MSEMTGDMILPASPRPPHEHLACAKEADNTREGLNWLLAAMSGRAPFPGDPGNISEKVWIATQQIAPWLLEQGVIIRARDFNVDPIGYMVDWYQLLADTMPFLREYRDLDAEIELADLIGRH